MINKEIFLEKDPVLKMIVTELITQRNCHTVILYGSRARGDFTSTSDYDVAGISKNGERQRIARFDKENNVYLDLFVYPESDFLEIEQEHLNMSEGIVLIDSNEFGKKLITKLMLLVNEPEKIKDDEIQARKVWYKKMLLRATNRDLEGKYRHIWSIFSILEDYFVFRGLRYQGPKKSFQYLESNDQETLSFFQDALLNTNDIQSLERLIVKIVGN